VEQVILTVREGITMIRQVEKPVSPVSSRALGVGAAQMGMVKKNNFVAARNAVPTVQKGRPYGAFKGILSATTGSHNSDDDGQRSVSDTIRTSLDGEIIA
jgi:hypothetical protein